MLEWNRFIVDDSRNLGNILGGGQILDLTVTSPPYWDLKNYGTDHQIGYRQTLDHYLDDLVKVFTEVWKCTKKTGSLWIVMKTLKKGGVLHLLPFKLAELLTNQPAHAWHLQDILVWHKPHTLPWSHKQKLQDNYESILCLSKSSEFKLDIDAVRSPNSVANWWVKYPERYHPLGKAISNVWEIPIPTQGSWGNGNMDHFCPLPIELARRAILLCSKKGSMVLDPFAGTGTIALAAEELGRQWLAIDINPQFQKMFYRRLAAERQDLSNSSRNAQVSLLGTNLRLRQLKYAILLYKRMAPSLRLTSATLPCLIVLEGHAQRSPAPDWVTGSKLILVFAQPLSVKRRKELTSAVTEHCGTAPLSKFQLDMEVSLTSLEELAELRLFSKKAKLFVYTRGKFWKVTREIEASSISDLANPSTFPEIISDISLNEHPAY
jgi:DNA modification methylase